MYSRDIQSQPALDWLHAGGKEVPTCSVDYCVVGERGGMEHGNFTILAGRDDRSRCNASIAVPQKGVDAEEYATRRCLRFLEFDINVFC